MGGFNLQDLMSVKAQYESLQRKMQETVVEASSGGGAITVKMDGRKQLQPAYRSRSGEIGLCRNAAGSCLGSGQRGRPQNRRADAIHGWRYARWPWDSRTVMSRILL